MNIETKVASLNDINILHELNKSCLPIYYSKFDYGYMLLFTNKYLILLGLYNGLICGYLVAEYNYNDNVHILSFGVFEDYRNKGIGRKLIEDLVLYIKESYREITLHVHVENQGGIKHLSKPPR